jgi:hypothetical protein
VAVWLCGCVAVWLCGCVAVWLCVCVPAGAWESETRVRTGEVMALSRCLPQVLGSERKSACGSNPGIHWIDGAADVSRPRSRSRSRPLCGDAAAVVVVVDQLPVPRHEPANGAHSYLARIPHPPDVRTDLSNASASF